MDRQQSRLLLGFGLAATAAVAVLGLWEPTEEPWDEAATTPVWDVSLPDVVGVVLERATDRIELVDRDGDWWVTEPYEAPADPMVVHEMIDMLQEVDQGISVPEAEPSDFGLDPALMTVTVRDSDGVEQTLDVGDRVPVGRRTYVRVASGPVVAVVGTLEAELGHDAAEFRDHAWFRVEPSELESIRLESPEGTLSLTKGDELWWLDGFGRASLSGIDELVANMVDRRVEAFVEDDYEGPIPNPRYRLTVTSKGKTQEVRVGFETPVGVLVDVWSGGRGAIQAQALEFLTMGPTDLADKRGFPFVPFETFRISARVQDQTATIEASGDGWDVIEDSGLIGERTAVEWLVGVQSADAVYRLSPPPVPAEEWGEVTLTRQDRVARVVLGPPGDDGFHVVRDDRGGAPYRISVEDVAALHP